MKKEEIITTSIMILIIVLEIFIQCYTKKSIEKLTSNLKELKEMTLEAQKNQEDTEEKMSNQNKEKNAKESANEKNGENMEENDEQDSENKPESNKENDTKNSDLSKKSQEIFKEWLKNFNVMAYFIEHDELEKVNTQMRLIMAEYEAKSLEDAVPEIEEGIFILEHIEDRQKITWKNIF